MYMMSGVKLRDRKNSSELTSMTGFCEDILAVGIEKVEMVEIEVVWTCLEENRRLCN